MRSFIRFGGLKLISLIPKEVFFTSGVGKHKLKLQSFEFALRDAGIEKCNLVTVSSILPPLCNIISKESGISKLSAGQITFCVMARCETNEPNRSEVKTEEGDKNGLWTTVISAAVFCMLD